MVNEEMLALINIARQYTLANMGRNLAKANEYFNRIDLNKEGVHDISRFNYYFRKAGFSFMQEKKLEGIHNVFFANFCACSSEKKKVREIK